MDPAVGFKCCSSCCCACVIGFVLIFVCEMSNVCKSGWVITYLQRIIQFSLPKGTFFKDNLCKVLGKESKIILTMWLFKVTLSNTKESKFETILVKSVKLRISIKVGFGFKNFNTGSLFCGEEDLRFNCFNVIGIGKISRK